MVMNTGPVVVVGLVNPVEGTILAFVVVSLMRCKATYSRGDRHSLIPRRLVKPLADMHAT
jgi:hypothetical protein